MRHFWIKNWMIDIHISIYQTPFINLSYKNILKSPEIERCIPAENLTLYTSAFEFWLYRDAFITLLQF